MPSLSLTLLRTQSDGRLLALAAEGHVRAFEAIVERYRRPLLRAARLVLPEGRAEDAVQQAFISAWTALQRGDQVRELRPWLYRIVHNCALNAHRVAGYDYDELHESLRLVEAPSEELERRAVIRQTLASVAALPERQREALLRTAISGDDQAEVARDLGLSENALRQLLHRARASVRAAATAITPLPALGWLLEGDSGRVTVVERIAELTAGAAPVGVAAGLAKAGTVVVVAGGALTGPSLVDRAAEGPSRAAGGQVGQAVAELERSSPTVRPDGAGDDGALVVAGSRSTISRSPNARGLSAPHEDGERWSAGRPGPETSDDHAGRRPSARGPRTGAGSPLPRDDRDDSEDREGPDDDDDDSGDRGDGRDEEGSEREADDRSGPGSGSGSGSSGSGSGSDDEPGEPEDDDSNSGSGSGDDDDADHEPEEPPEPPSLEIEDGLDADEVEDPRD